MTGRDPMDYGWWLASRASGIVALALISISVGLGLAVAGRIADPKAHRTLFAVHRHAAPAALVAIAVHGITLLGDRWLAPGPVGIVVPFAMDYRPLATGIGIVAGYALAALALSFHLRRWIGARRWRAAHRLTTAAYVLAVIHAFTAGTDASTPWMRALLVLAAAPVLFLGVMRVLPASAGASGARRGSAPSREPRSARSRPSPSA